ncbi:alpha/beta fold hydrolase [Qipengyuania aquimaris]|uniref:alpha/beta fold hydrolase n=1 Tax=Qipengyuania aquimaris TaxID=255984 RepID=UPI001CD5ACFA|nr:alpha/beta hydrolase [Qipengyuania aquimaris]MCA0902493.1 alpha/beta hydrolase [Qipengyuania aquimaris]
MASANAQATAPNFSPGPCEVGIYGEPGGPFVAITRSQDGFRYAFEDGRTGSTENADEVVRCAEGSILVEGEHLWSAIPIRVTNTRFASGEVMLAGQLLEPADADSDTPLIAYAHGSEPTGWIEAVRDPYQMLGRGISVFVFDKRGTGQSEGRYSQNFPRLADDLAAASMEAKRLAADRFGRFGLVGLSQGGWVAPLAAERSQADFIAIGYGLVADIREEDASQVQKELRDAGYGKEVLAIAQEITDVTARVASSDYKDGLDDLAAIQQQYASEPWFQLIRGGYTGVFLNTPVEQLREEGVPRFNDLDIDWSLEPMSVLRDVEVPQLWVLAGEDREAPIDLTLERLQSLRRSGSDIAIRVFPETDHGMWEYEQSPDGSREYLRVTPGYYDLMADYIKGTTGRDYGRSVSVAVE